MSILKKEIEDTRQDMIDGKIGRLDLAIGMLLNFKLEGIHYVNIGSSYFAVVDGRPETLVQSDLLLFFKNISSIVEITGEGRDLIYPK